jgi:hypothetical protein
LQPVALHWTISSPDGKRISNESSGEELSKRRRRPALEALELGGAGEVLLEFALVVFRGENNWQVAEFSTQYTLYGFPS